MAIQSNRSKAELARATHAFEQSKVAAEAELLDSYTSLSKKLPAYIQANGLGAALAFIKSKRNDPAKRKNEHRAMYEDLSGWLRHKDCPFLLPNQQDLAAFVIKLDGSSYRAYTLEVLAYLNWLRKFTDGLKKESSNSNDN